jgi:hypothetical protein
MLLKLMASAVVTLALVACGQPTGVGKPALPCNSGVCKLDVTVAAGGCADPANITVSPDPLVVSGANNIEWTIKTDAYTWVPAPGGITGLPPAQFSNAHDTGNGKKYDIHDANTDASPTDYKYGINLKDANGNLCAVKDPTIRNGS